MICLMARSVFIVVAQPLIPKYAIAEHWPCRLECMFYGIEDRSKCLGVITSVLHK